MSRKKYIDRMVKEDECYIIQITDPGEEGSFFCYFIMPGPMCV